MSKRLVTLSFLAAMVALLCVGSGRLVADDGQAEAAPIKLAGRGDNVSARFALQAGISTWAISHDGRSNFQINVMDMEGNDVAMPVNEIGRFRGTLLVRVVKPGEYLLTVKADGNWSVTIRQPRPTSGEAKPISRTGRGADVPVFVDLPKGMSIFRAKHDGDGVFRVKLFDREGKMVEQLFGRIGRYEGSRAYRVAEDGTYAIGIYANGNWSLRIE